MCSIQTSRIEKCLCVDNMSIDIISSNSRDEIISLFLTSHCQIQVKSICEIICINFEVLGARSA